MDRMPEPLTSFKQFVEADLRRAARLIIAIQDEIDPQFRIATPEGDYSIAVTLPNNLRERQMMMRRIATFFAFKQAASFVLASELTEPDCVYAVGVSHKEVHMCLSRIRREPRPWGKLNFGSIEWFGRESVGDEILDMMPHGARSMTETEIAMLEKWFGLAGRFPAVHVPSGEVRDLG